MPGKVLLLAVTILLGSSAAARQLEQFSSVAAPPPGNCSVPEGEEIDFSKIATSCSRSEDLCSTCICGTFDTFWSAIKASNVSWDPNDPLSLAALIGRVGSINRACLQKFETEVRSAWGPNNDRMLEIRNCSWLTNPSVPAPACHQKQLYSLATANFTQSNSSGDSIQVVMQSSNRTGNSSGTTRNVSAAFFNPASSDSSSAANSSQSAAAPGSLTAAPPALPGVSSNRTSSSANKVHKPATWFIMLGAGCLSLVWV